MMKELVIALIIALALITVHCQNASCTEPAQEHFCICEVPDEEMHKLGCQCEPANEREHFACDCWATQHLEPAEYLDCLDAKRKGQNESGVYLIQPNDLEPFEVYCDMENDGGGWTVFQRREDGSVDFYRDWANYTHGFGSVDGEHWLGLSKLYRLANVSLPNELQVDMGDFETNTAYAKYSTFSIEGSLQNYRLHVSGYTGTAGDSFTYHNGNEFSTEDKDNDHWGSNCAVEYTGPWWHNNCHISNPNGVYGDYAFGKGVNWNTFKGLKYSLKFIEFKIRRP